MEKITVKQQLWFRIVVFLFLWIFKAATLYN